MQHFKNQPGWTHVFGPNYHPLGRLKPDFPLARKSIHPVRGKWGWKRIRPGLKDLFHEFCSYTTIHGLRNVESGKTLLERLWWLTVLVLSVFFCAVLVHKVYQKWENNPVIVSFDDTPTPVWKVPFPAITICPEAKIRMELMNFTNEFYAYFHSNETLSQIRQDQLMAVLQICDEFFHYFLPYQEKYPNSSFDVVSLLEKVSVKMNKTVLWCRLARRKCLEDFTQTLTEDGVCFTFNGLSAQDMFNDEVLHEEYNYLTQTKSSVNWSMERGYAPDAPYNTHPTRGTGYTSRLRINLASYDIDVESHCSEEQGFKVVLHPPDEYPLPFAKYILLSLDRDINIAVRPQIIVTAPELMSYSPDRRQCFFNHERQLKFFRVYNQNNCELECLTNYTLAKCGCVRFSMPRSANTRVCSTAEQRCILEAHQSMLNVLSQNKLNPKVKLSACNCMSECTSINYLTEVTQSTYDYKETIGLRFNPMNPEVAKKLEKLESSKISIYFKEAEFIGSRRGELFGLTDFIANCGGILGLCIGASFVSLVELLYYCTVRPVLLVKKLAGRKRKVILVLEGHYGRY